LAQFFAWLGTQKRELFSAFLIDNYENQSKNKAKPKTKPSKKPIQAKPPIFLVSKPSQATKICWLAEVWFRRCYIIDNPR
jgi:hypothetical protein